MLSWPKKGGKESCIKQWHGKNNGWLTSTIMFHHEIRLMSLPEKMPPSNILNGKRQELNKLGRVAFSVLISHTCTSSYGMHSPWVEGDDRNCWHASGKCNDFRCWLFLLLCYMLRWLIWKSKTKQKDFWDLELPERHPMSGSPMAYCQKCGVSYDYLEGGNYEHCSSSKALGPRAMS